MSTILNQAENGDGPVLLAIIPKACAREQEYTLSVVLGDLLGLRFRVRIEDRCDTIISLPGSARTLRLTNEFFLMVSEGWIETIMPRPKRVQMWRVRDPDGGGGTTELPVVFGRPELEMTNEGARLGLDILGFVFFFITRFEEVVWPSTDNHGRFPGSSSIAHENGFLDRPFVDQYCDFLWKVINELWPGVTRRERTARTVVSCDVDSPYAPAILGMNRAARQLGGDLVKRRSVKAASMTLANLVASRFGNYRYDMLDQFDNIMEANERLGNSVVFYFLAGRTSERFDGYYDLGEPRIRTLLRRIHSRGHEIGLHGSYHTYLSEENLRLEYETLQNVLASEQIQQMRTSCRQHYLRWSALNTPRLMDAVGIDHDATVGFADAPGFRAGTCREYRMYDLHGRRPLAIVQSPLIVMECTISAKRYRGLGFGVEALAEFKKYKERCTSECGDFTVLWHNSQLYTAEQNRLYEEIIK